MDPNIISITQIVSGALGALKKAIDLAGLTNNAELRGQISEAYNSIRDLQRMLLDLDDENRRLKAELSKKAELEGPVPPFGYFFKNGDHEHPLCPKCMQGKESRESFLTPAQEWNGGLRRVCRICGLHIYREGNGP